MICDATPDDIEALVEMGERFARAEFGDFIKIDPKTLAGTLANMIAGDTTLLLAYESEGRIRGAIGAIVYAHPFSGETVAVETFWWVDPEARGAGMRLLRAAENWAREKGAVKMTLGAPAGRDMAEMYRKLGYSEVERSYQGRL